MEKIEFLIGSEKRFFDFISSLNDKDKIALISHNDLDGVAAAKVANKVLNADLIKFVSYTELNNKLVEELKKAEIKKVVLTDLLVEDEQFIRNLEKFSSVLSIDHHRYEKDFNSGKSIFLDAPGHCAAYICYYLFSKVQDISKLDWLVACACISDITFSKNWGWMEEVHKKYGVEVPNQKDAFEGGIGKLSNLISLAIIYFKDNLKKVFDSLGEEFRDVGDLERYSAEVQKEIDECISRFHEERKVYEDLYYWEMPKLKFGVKSWVTTSISFEEKDKTYLVGRVEGDYYAISARRQDGGEDMNLLLKKLIGGFEGSSAGGHIPAAGGHILVKYKEEFEKRLENLKDIKF